MDSLDGHQPAFPGKLIKRPHEHDEDCFFPGMTMREYFAGIAMQGLMSNPQVGIADFDGVAKAAVKVADALVAELHR